MHQDDGGRRRDIPQLLGRVFRKIRIQKSPHNRHGALVEERGILGVGFNANVVNAKPQTMADYMFAHAESVRIDSASQDYGPVCTAYAPKGHGNWKLFGQVDPVDDPARGHAPGSREEGEPP